MTSLIVGVFVLTSMYMCVLSRTGIGLPTLNRNVNTMCSFEVELLMRYIYTVCYDERFNFSLNTEFVYRSRQTYICIYAYLNYGFIHVICFNMYEKCSFTSCL